MFTNKIYLFVSSYDMDNSHPCVVSSLETKYKPISQDISPNDPSVDYVLQQTFEKYIDLSFFSIGKPIIVQVKKYESEIGLYYACSIPPKTLLKEGFYVSLNLAYIHPFTRKALPYV